MLRISEITEKKKAAKAKQNKRKKKSGNTSQRSRDAVNDRARHERAKIKVASLTAEAAKVGKVTAEGKRMCMWSDCKTVLSIYNTGECCGLHQSLWNEKNGFRFLA